MPRRKAEADAKIILPITPMLDMVFQLLFFFIMNFNPADLEGQMDMSLPSEDVKQAKDKQTESKANPEKNLEPEFPSDLTVQVRTQNGDGGNGSISAISVRGADGKEEPINGPDLLGGLKKYLEAKRATVTFKESIKIRGENKLRIRYLMQVTDACKAAGYTNTSLVSSE